MGPTRSLAYWLALVDRLVEERFSAALEEHGVTRLQWRILGVLSRGAANAEELDTALAELPPTDSDETPAEELDELMDSGWVLAGDGRFTLTERGQSAYDGLAEVVTELRTNLIDGIAPEEQEHDRRHARADGAQPRLGRLTAPMTDLLPSSSSCSPTTERRSAPPTSPSSTAPTPRCTSRSPATSPTPRAVPGHPPCARQAGVPGRLDERGLRSSRCRASDRRTRCAAAPASSSGSSSARWSSCCPSSAIAPPTQPAPSRTRSARSTADGRRRPDARSERGRRVDAGWIRICCAWPCARPRSRSARGWSYCSSTPGPRPHGCPSTRRRSMGCSSWTAPSWRTSAASSGRASASMRCRRWSADLVTSARTTISRSKPGVLRGFRLERWDKLFYVVRGVAFCVVVDPRPDSPTFGRSETFLLGDSPGLRQRLFVAQGLANAFQALEETDYLNEVSEALRPDEPPRVRVGRPPELGIEWPILPPILSDTDRLQPTFREMVSRSASPVSEPPKRSRDTPGRRRLIGAEFPLERRQLHECGERGPIDHPCRRVRNAIPPELRVACRGGDDRGFSAGTGRIAMRQSSGHPSRDVTTSTMAPTAP